MYSDKDQTKTKYKDNAYLFVYAPSVFHSHTDTLSVHTTRASVLRVRVPALDPLIRMCQAGGLRGKARATAHLDAISQTPPLPHAYIKRSP